MFSITIMPHCLTLQVSLSVKNENESALNLPRPLKARPSDSPLIY